MNGRPRFRWARLIIAVIVGELVPILALVAVVALAGPSDPSEAAAFARRAGSWVAPIVGSLTILVVSAWAGRGASAPVLQGVVIAVTLVLVDVTVLSAAGEAFAWIFVVSNGAKVAAGALGGWIASREGSSSS